MNILIFDKSPYVKTLIQRNLIQLKDTLNIVALENMVSANDALDKNDFDFAIIDMDNLSGMFLQFIAKARKLNPDIIVILLTAFPSKKIFEKFIDKGADYCFDKINDFEKLLNIMDKLISGDNLLKKVAG